MFSEISLGTWNINGIFNKILGDKTKNKDFLEAISKTDFMFLTETWSNVNLNIPGFEAINSDIAKSLSNAACRQSGGIVCCLKANLKNMSPLLKTPKISYGVKSQKKY